MSVLTKGIRRLRALRQRRSFALNDLDLKLEPYLNFDSGFFIEAGANNGRSQSNTLYFERYRKWRGLLIEPVPTLAAECKQNRPQCIVENTALVPFDFPDDHIQLRSCGLMTVVKGGMKSTEEELEHIRKGCEIQQIETTEVQAPARPLSEVLDQHQITKIDLLSLDVEGFELQALQGIDFTRHAPQFMLIEARYRQEIDDYLAPWYEPIADLSHHDVLYKRRA